MFFERNTSKKEQLKIGDDLDELCDFPERKMRNHSPLQFLKLLNKNTLTLAATGVAL